MADDISRIIDVLNEQKGEILALRVLLFEVFEALPLDGRLRVVTKFAEHGEEMLSTITFAPVPDAVLRSYRTHSQAIADLFAGMMRKA